MEIIRSFEVSITIHQQTKTDMPHDFSLDYKLFQKLSVVIGICSHRFNYYRQRLFEKFFDVINIWRINVKYHTE